MSDMSSMEAQLAEYDEVWGATKTEGTLLPEGVYQARLDICRVENSRFDNQPQLFMRWEDLGGAGSVPQWYNLTDQENGMRISKMVLANLGWVEERVSPLVRACESGFFTDLVCEIRVKDTVKNAGTAEEKTYKAVYINKLFGKQAVGAAVADDDDLPF